MIKIAEGVRLLISELNIQAIRAQGAGGQNVNKVSSAIHLRFDIPNSSLPEHIKARLISLSDKRITRDGVVVIKAQEHRTQEKNKQEAIRRLTQLISSVVQAPKRRVATKPKFSAKKKRVDTKVKKGRIKNLRGRVVDH